MAGNMCNPGVGGAANYLGMMGPMGPTSPFMGAAMDFNAAVNMAAQAGYGAMGYGAGGYGMGGYGPAGYGASGYGMPGQAMPGTGMPGPGYGFGGGQPVYGYGVPGPGYGMPGYGFGGVQPRYGMGGGQPGYGYGMPGYGPAYGMQGMQGMQGVAQATPQVPPGTQVLLNGIQNQTVSFYGDGRQQTFQMVADLLNRDPVMRQNFTNALNNGETFRIGTRSNGQPSFSTIGTQNTVIEFNTQDYQRAPGGAMEVIAHELTHALDPTLSDDDNLSHTNMFYSQVNASLRRAGYLS